MKRVAILMIWGFGLISFALADDVPKPARPRAATRKARPAPAGDEPPPCVHMVPAKAATPARRG